MNKTVTFADPSLDRQIVEIVAAVNRPVIHDSGVGIVMRSPDGTKLWRLTVNDAGAVTVVDATADFT